MREPLGGPSLRHGSWRRILNYRTTRQDLDYAVDILAGGQRRDPEDQEDTTLGYRPARRGPEPVIAHAKDAASMPQRYQLAGLGEAEAADVLQRERALLYGAASRARDALMITLSGEPSELLPAQ